MYLTCAVLLGFVLDTVLGDPNTGLHPACLIGRLVSLTEKILRRLFPKTRRGKTVAGVLLWLIVCGVSFAVPFFRAAVAARTQFLAGFCGGVAAVLADSGAQMPCRRGKACVPRAGAVD